MREEALIIFVRKPELGKVKTRLAASIGDKAALEIYQRLLVHTHSVSVSLPVDKYVFYAGEIEKEDLWRDAYIKLAQANADLGGKMKAAFACLFQKDHKRICIIGSDCFELTVEIISNAFSSLHKYDVVIGPARDGGYYLLGMRDEVKEVFDEIEWSTENVLQQTIKKIEQHHYSFTLLPMLTDVDTVEDLPPELLSIVKPNGS